MLHIFIGSRLGDRKPGVTGKPAPGYEAKVVDKDFNEVPRGTVRRLVVRGPTPHDGGLCEPRRLFRSP